MKLSKLGWYWNRWRVMAHPAEEIYRLQQFFRNQVLDRLEAARPPAIRTPRFTDIAGISYTRDRLRGLQPDDAPIETFPLLAHTVDDVRELRNWREDPRHRQPSPVGFTHAMDPQDYDRMGDIKYACVMSRMHFLPFFSLRAVAWGDEDAAEFITDMLDAWHEQNPYLRTINWYFGIEAGIRSLNLVLSRKLLGMAPVSAQTRAAEQRIDKLLALSCHYLERHPSLHSSANNHRVAEVLGLIAIATHYDIADRTAAIQRLGMEYAGLLASQHHPDGGNREQSLCYHVEVLDALVTGFEFLRAAGCELDWPDIHRRLTAAGEFLSCFLDDDGHRPAIGDDDEGHYLYTYFEQGNGITSVLRSLDLFLGTSQFSGGMDLRCYLIGGEQWFAGQHSGQPGPRRERSSRLFRDSGYAVFNYPLHRLIFDVGEIGMRPMAAHGHSDLLAFTLEYHELAFLVDPGTYQYHGRTPFRDYFRSVRAHNTLSVDGLNQARIGGRMMWLQQPDVEITGADLQAEAPFISARHDGFKKQGLDVVHERSIRFLPDESAYIVADQLPGNPGALEAELFLHFHPEVIVARISDTTLEAERSGHRIQLTSDAFAHARLHVGSEMPRAGWYSPRYDTLIPTTTVTACLASRRFTEALETRIDLL